MRLAVHQLTNLDGTSFSVYGLATHTISEAPFAPISKQMLPVYPMAFLIELNGWPFLLNLATLVRLRLQSEQKRRKCSHSIMVWSHLGQKSSGFRKILTENVIVTTGNFRNPEDFSPSVTIPLVGAHSKALNEAVLIAPSQILQIIPPFKVSPALWIN